MSTESTLIFFGFLTMVTPFLGLPYKWYGYIFFVLGLVVLGIGISFRMRRAHFKNQSTQELHDESSEHSDINETPQGPSPIA